MKTTNDRQSSLFSEFYNGVFEQPLICLKIKNKCYLVYHKTRLQKIKIKKTSTLLDNKKKAYPPQV